MQFNSGTMERLIPRIGVFALAQLFSFVVGFIVVGILFEQAPGGPVGKIWFGSWLLIGLVAAALYDPD